MVTASSVQWDGTGGSTTAETRLTVGIPADLLAATDRAVSAGHARTREDLVLAGLRHELDALARIGVTRREAIDADCQSEALLLDREFSGASWDGFREAEETCAALADVGRALVVALELDR